MSEFATMRQSLANFGIRHRVIWEFPKEQWQDKLDVLDLNLTSLALVGIQVEDTMFLFSKGEPFWTTYEDAPEDESGHRGWGCEGMFLGTFGAGVEITPRVKMRADGTPVEGVQGRWALEDVCAQIWPDFTPR